MIWFGMHKTHRVLTLKLAGIRYLLVEVRTSDTDLIHVVK
jgi:hypothetical protein